MSLPPAPAAHARMVRRLVHRTLAAAAVWGVLAAAAQAQIGGTLPPASHEFAKELLYRGDYRGAERRFVSELRGAVKTTQSRWLDSICFYAMLGETYYQQGRNGEALAQFDQACRLFLAYSGWMTNVQFQQPPRPDPAAARRRPPWGPSRRAVTYALLPDTMLLAQGEIDPTRQIERGGPVQTAQLWRVNVIEVVRCTALAIRRRGQLLGPLAPADRLSKELADTLGRPGIGPRNHWSRAWVDLQYGLALAAIGKHQQALPHFSRAVLLDGRYDHALTGAALLAQADAAALANQTVSVATLYTEAGLAAAAFDDLDVVAESFAAGQQNHQAGGGGPTAALAPALAWADQQNLHHLGVVLRNASAEQLAEGRQLQAAGKLLAGGSRRRRDVLQGRLGAGRDWLSARLIVGQEGGGKKAGAALQDALQRAAAVSLRNFQLGLANARYDSGALSARLAVQVYAQLLSDPTPRAWAATPAEATAGMLTDHDAAFDRWIDAALQRQETKAAIEISDLAKRRRFLRTQPLGGRLIALRRLLGADPAGLSQPLQMQQKMLLAAEPRYGQLAAEAASVERQLREAKRLVEDGRVPRAVATLLKDWGRLADAQESLLASMAGGRSATPLCFPPQRTADAARATLEPGEAILAFPQAGGAMHGFLLAAGGEHTWRLGDSKQVAAAVAEGLRGIGHFKRGRAMPVEEAASSDWRQAAAELSTLLLGGSRLDPAATRRLTIVPDGPLWHVPFAMLLVGDTQSQRPLIDIAPMRVAPTIGLAFAGAAPEPPTPRTGLIAPTVTGGGAERRMAERNRARLVKALGDPELLPTQSPAPSPLLTGAFDRVVVELEGELMPNAAAAWSPMPIDRKRSDGGLAAWQRLPAAAPRRLVLGGVRTVAESALSVSGRSSSVAPSIGDELFLAACGLRAAGAETVLLSRWPTGGALHGELVGEFVAELGRQPAADAWRRSVILARDATLSPSREPRLGSAGRAQSAPLAGHPFFWSGYLLLDAGVEPLPEEPEEDGPAEAPGDEAEAKPADAPEAKPAEAPEAKPAEAPEAKPLEVPEAAAPMGPPR
ncbi:MAG: hypothetical protein AAF790_12860 [Planctomycetota bacterium]